MRITTGTIVSLVLVLIFLTVFISVAEDVIPTASESGYVLFDYLGNGTAYLGSDAASFADDVPGYLGWFWVIGPFALVIMLVVGLFMRRGRRR